MSANAEVLEVLNELAAVEGVRGAMLATADGAVGAAEHTKLSIPVAADLSKTVRRLSVASTTANAPMLELLINFGPSRMMLRPVAEDVLVILLEPSTDTSIIRELLNIEVRRLQHVIHGAPAATAYTVGVHEADDEVSELLATPLGPILREIEAVYRDYRARSGEASEQTRALMHEQIREWLLCCNPSNYTLPLLLDGLSESMAAEPSGQSSFVSEVQKILRKTGALR